MKSRIISTLTIVVAGLLSLNPATSAVINEPLVNEAVVNAPLAEVWKDFTTKEGIESWMVAKTEIDLRIGGAFRTSYSKTSNLDDDASIHHMILAYDPLKMLSYRTIKPPNNFPFPKAILDTWNVIYLEPVDASHTRVTARMMGFGDDDESTKMRAFFQMGNKTTIDSLVKKYLK